MMNGGILCLSDLQNGIFHCKLVFVLFIFLGFKRLKRFNVMAVKGKESERQQQRQQPSLPIWAVFGQPSRGHMAVWVKELF